MSTTIFYYTGTGNSLWVAKELADKLDNAALHSIPKVTDAELTDMDFDSVGFVFPVHIWGVPGNVLNFIEGIKSFAPNYCFAVATNGGQVANTLVQLKKFLRKKGVTLNSGFDIMMPSNYIPWGGPGPVEKQQKLFAK
ncbi:MAG TPA: EFR1 family ferrodoxin, partial [Bacteroidales bacterium]|nr:EFR1 family ferrodoxin [Bacteroidales bacterium]